MKWAILGIVRQVGRYVLNPQWTFVTRDRDSAKISPKKTGQVTRAGEKIIGRFLANGRRSASVASNLYVSLATPLAQHGADPSLSDEP